MMKIIPRVFDVIGESANTRILMRDEPQEGPDPGPGGGE